MSSPFELLMKGLLPLAGLLVLILIPLVLYVRQYTRRMGTAVEPISMRLIATREPMPPELESRAAELAAAGFREAGRFVTDRAPRMRFIGFVDEARRMTAQATEHPCLGIYTEVTCGEPNGRSVQAFTAKIPAMGRTAPWCRLISRPGASASELVACVQDESAGWDLESPSVRDYGRRWEEEYFRIMHWMYAKGPGRKINVPLLRWLTGLPVDAETAAFLEGRHRGWKSD